MKLSALLPSIRSPKSGSFPPISPDTGFYAVGDIHGRSDLLDKVLTNLPKDLPILCLGDYVDRGEDSAEVLQCLCERSDILCLLGNHEEMLLGFLDDPQKLGTRWIRNGGLQTLASFGVTGVSQTTRGVDLKVASDALRHAMGSEMINWLRHLPRSFTSGNVTALHAGADPALPINQQDPQVLTWGHPNFLKVPRRDGQWVVHGHTVMERAQVNSGRISVDTGAYATDKLSVARITPGEVEFDTA